MSAKDFERALAFVARWEGGWSDRSTDPGGATMYGVTWMTYRSWYQQWHGVKLSKKQATEQLREISPETAKQIFKELYWDKCGLDAVTSRGLCLVVFDAAVNQGVGRAGKFLQKAANRNTNHQLKVDGIVGPNTRRVVNEISITRDRELIRDFTVYRMLHYSSLVHMLAEYGVGWFRRAVSAAMEAVL